MIVKLYQQQDISLLKPKGEKMLKQRFLACCKLYISESQNLKALESIERAASTHHPEAVLVNKFLDTAYNRVGYTLVSNVEENLTATAAVNASSPLVQAAYSMVEAALQAINLEQHCGTHPRLGVVDHICFHPLAQASLSSAACLANSLAADIGRKLQVATYLYGAVHREGRPLDYIRRSLGYFKPNMPGFQWVGCSAHNLSALKPDTGPTMLDHAKGIVVVGATPWVDNYNVPIFSSDIIATRRIARLVSGRGGGLPGVQAMALLHGEGIVEIACNLLEPNRVGADAVQSEVRRLAMEVGLKVGEGYFTDLSQQEIIESYLKNKSMV